jgi:methyltransferase family protein
MITTPNRYDHAMVSRMMEPKVDTSKIFRGWLGKREALLAISSIEEAAEKTTAEWFVELGVKHAGTSRMICEVLNACGRRSRLLGVDLDEKARPHWKEQLAGRAGPKCSVAEARLEIAKSYDEAPAALVPDGGTAWILVDACHCRTCVEQDIARWAPKVAVGGLMVFHDTDWRVQLRKPCQSAGHGKPERPGVYDAVMNSPILREAFHLAQALEGGTDRKSDFWEGTQVWRRHA